MSSYLANEKRSAKAVTVLVVVLGAVIWALTAMGCGGDGVPGGGSAEAAGMPDAVDVEAVFQEADSITYQAVWTAGRNVDGSIAPSHDWEAGADDDSFGPISGTVPASDSAADGTLSTTFTVPMDSTEVSGFFCVAARNSNGTSEQACNGFTVPALSLAPSTPGSPSIQEDTVATAPDTSTVAAVALWPDSLQVAEGDSAALHAFIEPKSGDGGWYSCVELTDGRRGLMPSTQGSTPPNVEFRTGHDFIEMPDCEAGWQVEDSTVASVRGVFVFLPDSGETGVRSIEYGMVNALESSTAAALSKYVMRMRDTP